MKKLLLLIVLISCVFANSLQKLPSSFSSYEKDELLKEFLKSSNSLYTSKAYRLQKGWNKLTTPEDGVDIEETFNDTLVVKFVVTYDNVAKLWAMYKPSNEKLEGKILLLKYLEPNITFFILAKKDAIVQIKKASINSTCQKFIDSEDYDFIVDSGINKAYTLNNTQTIGLRSRYFSHNERGIYDETRVMLIYPKVKSKTQRTYKYGPAIPKIALEFSKEYENKKFYIYDYKYKKCYMGIFPSIKVPPFPTLKEY